MLDSFVLFIGAFVAAAISGAAGFGGALLLMPLLVIKVGAAQAVPLLTIAQLVGNLSRAGFGFNQIHWKPVGLFLVTAIPFSVLGALSFVELPNESAARIIGAVILIFVALKYFNLLNLTGSPLLLIIGGSIAGFLSGLVGSAGPLAAAIFLSLGLPPVSYIASEAMTAIAMHSTKMLVYQHFVVLDKSFWFLAGLMSAAMIIGTWTAKRIVERLSRDKFQRFVSISLVAIATYMLVHG
ncbi:sulfite exporter TauE/SafE family protein [Mariprofundus ferrooxydans]|uniref:Probable membrane transporter protein n=1 Tax=Mariprofundus ferrooxydans PV-1 TaxID=314345 RepID=Q0F1N5_9PROT|nr:sulfite exporter TauE/SafE family protein [Mariprofundus ferrooxydans]EAU55156.1 hypothetical protein SPV1_10506 [Mariprofundus ferrooxydans PV-1]